MPGCCGSTGCHLRLQTVNGSCRVWIECQHIRSGQLTVVKWSLRGVVHGVKDGGSGYGVHPQYPWMWECCCVSGWAHSTPYCAQGWRCVVDEKGRCCSCVEQKMGCAVCCLASLALTVLLAIAHKPILPAAMCIQCGLQSVVVGLAEFVLPATAILL